MQLVEKRFPDIDASNQELMTEKIYDIASEVQSYVNQFYDVFADKVFNVKKHRFEIKQEMIAKTGFWQKKKRYALWIISDNGVPKDELEVKGLDVVRSSFPKSFKDIMKSVLVGILKEKPQSEIDDSILSFKKNLSGILFGEVAKTSSIKDIDKYQFPVKDEVLGKFIKGTPSHVKASINYNKLLKVLNCSVKYSPIKNGDKVKIAYLKNNTYGIEELAFRGEMDPQEILDFICENFDSMSLFNSELDGKLRSFYESMGWDYPSEYAKTASKFFSF